MLLCSELCNFTTNLDEKMLCPRLALRCARWKGGLISKGQEVAHCINWVPKGVKGGNVARVHSVQGGRIKNGKMLFKLYHGNGSQIYLHGFYEWKLEINTTFGTLIEYQFRYIHKFRSHPVNEKTLNKRRIDIATFFCGRIFIHSPWGIFFQSVRSLGVSDRRTNENVRISV